MQEHARTCNNYKKTRKCKNAYKAITYKNLPEYNKNAALSLQALSPSPQPPRPQVGSQNSGPTKFKTARFHDRAVLEPSDFKTGHFWVARVAYWLKSLIEGMFYWKKFYIKNIMIVHRIVFDSIVWKGQKVIWKLFLEAKMFRISFFKIIVLSTVVLLVLKHPLGQIRVRME